MADWLEYAKNLIFPGNESAFKRGLAQVPNEIERQPSVWDRTVSTVKELPQLYSDAFRGAAEQFAGVDPANSANAALIPRRGNLGQFQEIMAQHYNSMDPRLPHATKLGISYLKTRYPNRMNQVPVGVKETIPSESGTTKGAYYPEGNPYEGKTEPFITVAHSPGGREAYSRDVASTGAHETQHARDDLLFKRLHPDLKDVNLYEIAGKVAEHGVKDIPRDWLKNASWEEVQRFLPKELIDEIRQKTPYSPKDFEPLLDKFYMPQNPLDVIFGKPSESNLKYVGNPYEIAAREAGMTGEAGFYGLQGLHSTTEWNNFMKRLMGGKEPPTTKESFYPSDHPFYTGMMK